MSKRLTITAEQESETVSPPTADLHVIQRDDGRYQIGIADDAPGPFETRAFARAVAAKGWTFNKS